MTQRYTFFVFLFFFGFLWKLLHVLFWWVQVRILKSLFPPLILELYKLLIAPLAQGKIAALMVGEFSVSIFSEDLLRPAS